jgi:hypothetical protein
MIKGKRGQELSVGTIILIVLGIAILVFLIWGFSVGWGNFFERISAFTGGGSNVDTLIQACTLSCSSQSQYDFCTLQRTVNLGNGIKGKASCVQMANSASITTLKDSSGAVANEDDAKISGIESCPGLCSN